jgi:hypothetical protein
VAIDQLLGLFFREDGDRRVIGTTVESRRRATVFNFHL